MAEPDAARAYNMGPAANLKIDTEAAQASISQMAAAMKGLEKALSDFGNNAYAIADKINRHLKSIGDTATKVTQQLAGMGSALSAAGAGGGGGSGGGNVPAAAAQSSSSGGGGNSGWMYSATSSASAAIQNVVDKKLPGGLSLGAFVGSSGDDLTKDLALAPLRYLRSRINTNRDTAIMASGGLNMTANQQGVNTASMMSTIAKFPGSIYGTPQDMISMFGDSARLGASYNFGGNPEGQGVRAAGLFKGVREAQMLNPLAQVGGQGGLVSQIGGYAADTGSQQRAQMFTGGTMGMIAAGGRQKSLSEWAESILRWFEGLRPGANRGKGFSYGELMAQYFPGSNIDAWFNTTGVPQNMRDYWWTYALSKTSKGASSTEKGFEIGADKDNVAWQRLRAGSELTRTEFSLAGKMSGQYAQREGSNRWFNELMGSIQEKVIPALSNSIFRWIQYLPDSLEDLMMTGAERGMNELVGGGDVPNAFGGMGDIGDAYGATGGNGLSGLHPDMKSKVGAMMKANPKLRMTSGLRDTGIQERLRAKGYSNVSGKPSAHTRGMAADLGPRSQYGWIMKNAKKFGLASGKNHGEPWHVGMPGDISGVGDADIGDNDFDKFVDSIKDVASSPEGMAGFITKILSTMTGALGKLIGGTEQTTAFATDADDMYKRLAGSSSKTVLGMTPKVGGFGGVLGGVFNGGEVQSSFSQTAKGESVAGTGTGWGGTNGKIWKGTSASGRGDKYNQTASPDIVAGIQSSDPIERGVAVAKALHNAGFSGDVLKNFLKISYRESHWTANAWNSGPVDESGGILQANQKPWTDKGNPSPFTQADAMDPQAAAFIAWDQYRNVSPMNGPGGPNTMRPWNINGNPFGGIPAEAAGLADQALKKAGLGDVEAMAMAYNYPSRQGGGNIVFQNDFKLSVGGYGGGANGGIDVRRTVNLIADHLEDEMKRRLVRSA